MASLEQVRQHRGAQARQAGARDQAEEHDHRHAFPCRGPARGRHRQAAPRRTARSRWSPPPCRRRKALEAKAGGRHPVAHPRHYDERFADLDAMGIDMQLIMPPPPQCYYTVPLDIAVKAARMVNDGIAEYRRASTRPLRRARHRAAAGRQRGGQGTRALHEDAQLQGRRDSHQRRRQGTVRSRLRAVLEEGRGARRAGRHPPQRLHRGRSVFALLFQQRHRQSARDHASRCTT